MYDDLIKGKVPSKSKKRDYKFLVTVVILTPFWFSLIKLLIDYRSFIASYFIVLRCVHNLA